MTNDTKKDDAIEILRNLITGGNKEEEAKLDVELVEICYRLECEMCKYLHIPLPIKLGKVNGLK